MINENDMPLLEKEDIECRVQSVKKGNTGVGAVLLLYKDARVDMRVLDQVFGRNNWQRTHELINGELFCNIDIWDSEKGSWVRKQDVGTESNVDKKKGQASDAFKRAGFNVGIGRELYTAPFLYVMLKDTEYYIDKGNIKCSPGTKFEVAHIGYNDRREINELKVVDKNGELRFDMNRRNIGLNLQKPPQEQGEYAASATAAWWEKIGEIGFSRNEVEERFAEKFGDIDHLTKSQLTTIYYTLKKELERNAR